MPSGQGSVGCSDTLLIVLRGNSASGKSTVAEGVRSRLGRGVAMVEQDYLRRTVLREHDQPDLPNIGLIDVTIRYALDAGYHVIAEGIFGSQRYGDMLRRLTDDHRGPTGHYYLDVPLAETQRRHLTKAFTVPAEKLAEWYHPLDLLELADERVITADKSADEMIDEIVRDVGIRDAPIRTRLQPGAHL